MINFTSILKKEQKRRRVSLTEAQVIGQVRKVLSDADQKLITMVRG